MKVLFLTACARLPLLVRCEYFLPQRRMRIAGPRRDDECNRERQKHRRARADRNRPHVRPHQAADEGHRQHGGDHGEGRENGRIADFVHGFDGNVRPVAAFVLREMKMADDILHHDDRIIDENADGKDQREERDAIEGETVEIKDQQRERERRRNGNGDDRRFAPAERKQNQHRDAEDGDAHVEKQFVGFFRRGFAVVARDRDFDIVRNDRALERFDFSQAPGARPRSHWRRGAWRCLT